jgi:choice-of-anchor B domain-containing protein
MVRLMKAKVDSWERTDRCIADGSCPELSLLPIGGSYKCNSSGIAGDIPCKNIDQLSFLTFEQQGYVTPAPGETNKRGNDVWGWEDPETGDEYAIMGMTGGTSFVRVTDPERPVPVGFMYTATVASSWRDIKVIGNWAYIVSEARDHGLQVFDLTRLRGLTTIQYFQPDAVNNDFGQAHNIASNSDTNFVYVVGARTTSSASGQPFRVCRGGLLVLDVSNPRSPRYAGCFGDDGYVHDTQCVIYHGPHVQYQGREICFCFNENSLTIVDVTNKNAMTMISKEVYINVAYTHQGWLTEDHATLLLDDELDERGRPSDQQFTKTYVWDVANLLNPTLKTIFQSSERSVDHNQYIIGDYTYQGNYESGLRINKINRETFVLTNVAYFDVYPARTTAEFNGAWSVYPYFRSGSVAVSSINHGLFIVKPDWPAIEALVESNMYAEQTRTRSMQSSSTGATCPHQLEKRACAAPVAC